MFMHAFEPNFRLVVGFVGSLSSPSQHFRFSPAALEGPYMVVGLNYCPPYGANEKGTHLQIGARIPGPDL